MSRIIAITGATGFAGRHAVAALLAKGHGLRALVRSPATANLPEGVETVSGDLADEAALDRLLAGADAVIHLAGAIAAADEASFFKANFKGTQALAQAALKAGTRRFVHVSSLAARQPGLSPYAASKRAGEDVIAEMAVELHAVILRPPAVYGPGDKGTLPLLRELTKPIAAIPAPRNARFSLIHAADLGRLLADAVEGEISGLHEVSDGKEGGYGWDELLAIASRFRGAPVRGLYLPRPVPLAVALGAELMTLFTGKPGMVTRGKIAELYHPDWVARTGTLALADPTSFEKGFAETVAWYRQAGWLPRSKGTDRTAASIQGPET